MPETHEMIEYRPDNCFPPTPADSSAQAPSADPRLLGPSMLDELAPRLEVARKRVAAAEYPSHWSPIDSGFIRLPGELLEQWKGNDADSILGRTLAAGRRLGELCDRVVLLGIGGSSMGTRALHGALSDPYHNELEREQRSGPRLYFEGDNVDSDSLQSLLDLLKGTCTDPTQAKTRFGIIVISKSGTTLETSVAFRVLRRFAREFYQAHPDVYQKVTVAVTGPGSQLYKIAEQDKLESVFEMPDNVGGRYSVFTPVGIVPAAMLKMDVAKLLAGAADMTNRFLEEPAATNPVLRYAGIGYLTERKRGATIRVLTSWGKPLEWVGYWYDQLLAESLGKHGAGATPITTVGTRDLHSRGQQHQDGRHDKLITNLRVQRPRRSALAIGPSDQNLDGLDAIRDKTIFDAMNAAADGTNQAYSEASRPTADILLPSVTEYTLGQLFQFFMIATVVEGLLMDVNPFGQPGVEAYKKNMTALLRAK